MVLFSLFNESHCGLLRLVSQESPCRFSETFLFLYIHWNAIAFLGRFCKFPRRRYQLHTNRIVINDEQAIVKIWNFHAMYDIYLYRSS